MNLSELLKNLRTEEIIGGTDVEITGLSTDSRLTKSGNLFFCYKGCNHDSHNDIAEAVQKGAAAVICERKLNCNITQIITANGREQIAPAAQAFYGFADKKLKIIAVTGTNGKTTTTYMLESIFKAAGKKTGVIGTLGVSYGGVFISPELTTPDPIYLHSVFADMVVAGIEYVFMEVSAHALYFDKINGIRFETGIFTNCTQDHLDFFKNMREYSECKKLLFKEGRCRRAVINSDDALGVALLSEVKGAMS